MAEIPTVLIVDDEVTVRDMLVNMLSLEGIATETARNGREALDLLARSGPRVVLLDLLMPEIDGWGVMRSLNDDPAVRQKHRVILVSAWANLQRAFDLKPDGTVSKPFTLDQIIKAISTAAATM